MIAVSTPSPPPRISVLRDVPVSRNRDGRSTRKPHITRNYPSPLPHRLAKFPSLFSLLSQTLPHCKTDLHKHTARYLSHSCISSKSCLHVIVIVSCILVPAEYSRFKGLSKLLPAFSAAYRARDHSISIPS